MSNSSSFNVSEEAITLIKPLADERQQTVEEFIRDCIKLGIVAAMIQQSPDKALMVKDANSVQELLF